jgi:uncharacterized protein YaiL (DUF2058 family)
MSDSLRDQLLKAGLVSKKQAKEAQVQVRKKAKQARHAQKSGKHITATDSAAYDAAKARRDKVARDRELNRTREAAREQKALQAQVRELIACHQANVPDGDIAYHFIEGKHIKHIYVTAEQHGLLCQGRLAIAAVDDQHFLIPTEVGEKLLRIAPNTWVYIARQRNGDDPYADHPIPDDLRW